MATLTKRRLPTTNTTPLPAFSRDAYLRLVRAALPIPPESEADNDRLIQIMLELEDKADESRLTPEEKAFSELLAIVVQDFEQRHYSLPALSPHELLQEVMEQRGMTHKDPAALVGNKGLTSEILAGRRKVSPSIAKRISAALHLPIETLL